MNKLDYLRPQAQMSGKIATVIVRLRVVNKPV